jgi:hypothetical protein
MGLIRLFLSGDIDFISDMLITKDRFGDGASVYINNMIELHFLHPAFTDRAV